ncbi:Histidine kinase [Lentibacillus sp. JNUCC-1]|uniref:HAMP domain-containing sensor histidine kinase n=1 Tax=Lentibacillus sp. JNUCC-1 TaxID=2654513 RepID=UPI0012E92AFC|nr:HAMP domain-containing histidine kinase [Lentibacillus sp. JNUCC-1]MUV38482.1 Histidine kinase [Lentibacillus sp. JNUCC-1]
MKLRTKIQLFSSLFMLILLLLINTSVYYLFYKITAESELDELVEQTNTIVRRLNDDPNISEKKLLRAYLPQDGMIRVVQEDESLLLGSLTRESEYTDIPPEFSRGEKHYVTSRGNGLYTATVAKPIIWTNGDIVTLEVTRHLNALKENMNTLLYVLIAASLLMLIPTYVAGLMLARFLLSPIRALTRTMQTNSKESEWQKIEVNNRSKDELFEMEATFNQMIEHLKANFEKQEMFVSDASHELKTPISIIKSYAQMVRRRGYDDRDVLIESIETIESEADRMQKLVEQMLELAKNKGTHELENVNLSSLVTETAETFERAYNRDVILNEQDDHVLVKGSHDQLQQIFYILIDNAFKYSDGDIHVTVRTEHNLACVDIADEGPGIPEKAQPDVFNRFYRIDKARSRETGGTGLGLAIAKTIAQTHDGDLTLTSIVGKGTTFTLELPALIEK